MAADLEPKRSATCAASIKNILKCRLNLSVICPVREVLFDLRWEPLKFPIYIYMYVYLKCIYSSSFKLVAKLLVCFIDLFSELIPSINLYFNKYNIAPIYNKLKNNTTSI